MPLAPNGSRCDAVSSQGSSQHSDSGDRWARTAIRFRQSPAGVPCPRTARRRPWSRDSAKFSRGCPVAHRSLSVAVPFASSGPAQCLRHLPERDRPVVKARLRRAWAGDNHTLALEVLRTLASWLQHSHPGAAASLSQGLEETLILTRLGIRGRLKTTLVWTNPVESMIDHRSHFAQRQALAVRGHRYRSTPTQHCRPSTAPAATRCRSAGRTRS